MENPTFKLAGIVKTKDEMADFEGPLSLILQLLSKNKIEIKDIQISLLLDQYLAYLDEIKALDLEIASEFVEMASYLVYLKTRTLLYADEENTELEELISTLESIKCRDVYARIRSVTEQFSDLYRRGGGTYAKPPEPLLQDREYQYQHDKQDIADAILRVFDQGEARNIPAVRQRMLVPQRIIYSVTEKSEQIIHRLERVGVMRIRRLFSESRSRTELVATFIAVLELCKDGRIYLSGTDDDLIISSVQKSAADVGA